ncbi:hypothetical protein ACM66B_001682 [Microbotryomycetes sp. NB124-2]
MPEQDVFNFCVVKARHALYMLNNGGQKPKNTQNSEALIAIGSSGLKLFIAALEQEFNMRVVEIVAAGRVALHACTVNYAAPPSERRYPPALSRLGLDTVPSIFSDVVSVRPMYHFSFMTSTRSAAWRTHLLWRLAHYIQPGDFSTVARTVALLCCRLNVRLDPAVHIAVSSVIGFDEFDDMEEVSKNLSRHAEVLRNTRKPGPKGSRDHGIRMSTEQWTSPMALVSGPAIRIYYVSALT